MHNKHITTLTALLVSLIFGLLLFVFVINGAIKAGGSAEKGTSEDLPSGIHARLTGHGESEFDGVVVTIAAVLNANKESVGGISGKSIAFKNFKGNIVELEPPRQDKDFWCANVSITQPESEGDNRWLWFIRDNTNGTDELSFIFVDDQNAACNDFLTPPAHWSTLSKGDFKGEVRP